MSIQNCAACKTAFETAGRGRYCSRACQVRAYRKRRRGRVGSRPCDQCGEPYLLDPPGKRYCSERCAKAHSNAQQAARRAAEAQSAIPPAVPSGPTRSPRPPTPDEIKAHPHWAGCQIVDRGRGPEPTIGEERALADYALAQARQKRRGPEYDIGQDIPGWNR